MTRPRLAWALWLVWAVVVWNVVFDRVLVLAGRRYVWMASSAAIAGGPYVRIDDVMRPALQRALWTATASAGALLGVGILAIVLSARASRRPALE